MDYEKILFADNKLEENFEAEKPQETLEETCHLDYGYVLNESERYSETEANIFADKIADVLSTDLEKAGDVVTAQENDIQMPHAFDKNYKDQKLDYSMSICIRRFVLSIGRILWNERCNQG